MKLKKFHRGISFEERNRMEPCIKLNTERGRKATTDIENDFFKLTNNSVFGKTMENIRNRDDIELVT